MRRRFGFRLARLLRVRAIEEQVARAEWGLSEALARDQERLRAERAEALALARAELAGRLAPGNALHARWMLQAERALEGQATDLRRTHEDALTRRAQAEAYGRVWRDRERDRRVLAELEGRARARHREELERWDNAQLDEQALLRRAAELRRRRREEDSSSNVPASDT